MQTKEKVENYLPTFVINGNFYLKAKYFEKIIIRPCLKNNNNKDYCVELNLTEYYKSYLSDIYQCDEWKMKCIGEILISNLNLAGQYIKVEISKAEPTTAELYYSFENNVQKENIKYLKDEKKKLKKDIDEYSKNIERIKNYIKIQLFLITLLLCTLCLCTHVKHSKKISIIFTILIIIICHLILLHTNKCESEKHLIKFFFIILLIQLFITTITYLTFNYIFKDKLEKYFYKYIYKNKNIFYVFIVVELVSVLLLLVLFKKKKKVEFGQTVEFGHTVELVHNVEVDSVLSFELVDSQIEINEPTDELQPTVELQPNVKLESPAHLMLSIQYYVILSICAGALFSVFPNDKDIILSIILISAIWLFYALSAFIFTYLKNRNTHYYIISIIVSFIVLYYLKLKEYLGPAIFYFIIYYISLSLFISSYIIIYFKHNYSNQNYF